MTVLGLRRNNTTKHLQRGLVSASDHISNHLVLSAAGHVWTGPPGRAPPHPIGARQLAGKKESREEDDEMNEKRKKKKPREPKIVVQLPLRSKEGNE